MKEPIVVGINDSGANEAAVTWAMHRAAALKLPVVLVHAVDDRWMSESFVYNEMASKAATKLLGTAKARAAGVEPTVDVRTALISGTAGYALRKRSKKASLVVIGSGTHVRTGGRLTDRALQIASVALCPVAVVGEDQLNNRRGVIVGVDGSEESTQAVAFAAAEADREGQELTVLHAYPMPGSWLQKGLPEGSFVEQFMEEERLVLAETIAGLAEKYPDLVVHKVLATDPPAQALTEAASKAKLLVLGSRGRGGIKRLLLGSTAHAVLAQLPCRTIITRVRRVKNTK
ncbi:universal stress protein [Arthrobacter sp. efr-133-TYG-118]|uniref:universal stress protein n=1 Tax=Arthrobacter sp. efr-133-TYG-118 TaxID=3040279 RepID=UPI002550D2A2|nr:universal stress protein [Arthrobacter sp. efr-133-TYG-118]